MKQRQQVCNGEPTPLELLAGLAKMLLQYGSIGHGATGAIDPKGAMAQPASFLEWVVLQSLAHGAEELLEHRERELHARLTIGGSRHVEFSQMTEVGARGIPVQNLDKKQLNRRHRIKRALPPPLANVPPAR